MNKLKKNLNLFFFCCRASHNQLRSLPVEVFTFKNLHSLSLQQNLLESLPEELGQLENLFELVTTHVVCSHTMPF